METGTLEQIGAKDGDKVFCISNVIDYEDGERYNTFTSGKTYTFASRDMIGDNGDERPGCHPLCGVWRIISRAAQPAPDLTAITTPFGLLDEAAQEALRAHGGPYERWFCEKWEDTEWPGGDGDYVYRVKSIPAMEEVIEDAFITNTGRIIFERQSCYKIKPITIRYNRINGEMDLASYRVDPR